MADGNNTSPWANGPGSEPAKASKPSLGVVNPDGSIREPRAGGATRSVTDIPKVSRNKTTPAAAGVQVVESSIPKVPRNKPAPTATVAEGPWGPQYSESRVPKVQNSNSVKGKFTAAAVAEGKGPKAPIHQRAAGVLRDYTQGGAMEADNLGKATTRAGANVARGGVGFAKSAVKVGAIGAGLGLGVMALSGALARPSGDQGYAR